MISIRKTLAMLCAVGLLTVGAYLAVAPAQNVTADTQLALVQTSDVAETPVGQVEEWEYTARPIFTFLYGRDFARYGRCRLNPPGPPFNFPGPPDVNPPPFNPIGPAPPPSNFWSFVN